MSPVLNSPLFTDRPISPSFKVGAIALAFLIIGYQAALFTTRAARLRLEANRDHPDTVFVYAVPPGGAGGITAFSCSG